MTLRTVAVSILSKIPLFWKREKEWLMPLPVIATHRGLEGYPENTLPAIEAAIRAGFKIIEIDLHITKDGHFVLIHDKTINRTSNGQGYVHDFTLKQLKQYDFGSWYNDAFAGTRIPTIEETLDLAKKNDVVLNLDCVNRFDSRYYYRLIKIIKDYGMQNQTYIEITTDMLLKMFRIDRTLNYEIAVVDTVTKLNRAKFFASFSGSCVMLNRMSGMPSANVVNAIHKQGFKASLWTCRTVEEIYSAIEMGYDIIGCENISVEVLRNHNFIGQ